jgi:hypothetical protein
LREWKGSHKKEGKKKRMEGGREAERKGNKEGNGEGETEGRKEGRKTRGRKKSGRERDRERERERKKRKEKLKSSKLICLKKWKSQPQRAQSKEGGSPYLHLVICKKSTLCRGRQVTGDRDHLHDFP